jgi:hypothetical protein
VPLAQGASQDAGTLDAGDPLTPLAALAARGQELAPGMRVVAQGEDTSPKDIDLPKVDVDLCVRAVFAADAPVKASLTSSSGDRLATLDPSASATLGPRGPVCIRHGQTLTLHLEQPSRRVRWVVWGAP